MWRKKKKRNCWEIGATNVESMEVGKKKKKTKNRVSMWFSNLAPGQISRGNKFKKIAALFTITKTRKQPKSLSFDRGMDKDDVVHTYSGLSHLKKENEIMPFGATWMNLEITVLSEISQKEKKKYHV